MAWYTAGTVTVTNGSPIITGTGTDFVPELRGYAFVLPGTPGFYQIASVDSPTRLTLARAWMGGNGGGQAYDIVPTESVSLDLVAAIQALTGDYRAVRDGIGRGLMDDGSQAAPGLRFRDDQDTGWRRYAANAMALVTGGTDRLMLDANGNAGVGCVPLPNTPLQVRLADNARLTAFRGSDSNIVGVLSDAGSAIDTLFSGSPLRFGIGPVEVGRFDVSGNMLVGTTVSTGWHRIVRAAPINAPILTIGDGSRNTLLIQSVGAEGWALANAALYVGRDTGTGRSINAGGTVNASGADYAEYMTKADGCGTIAPGQVCGVDAEGRLTLTWADAMAFVVKSTQPGVVLGDSWSSRLDPRPEAPQEPRNPGAAPDLPDSDDPDALRAWRQALDAHAAAEAAYRADHAAWVQAMDAHRTALAAWDAALEAERQKVDRIAFCGQVPVDVDGPFAPGDYLIAEQDGDGIRAIAVPEADITFPQYRRRLGRVWAVRAGRAWIDVQHG